MNRPNILYINSHDTGRTISPHGHSVDTPNLQRLAEEGVLFRQNFCINPTCSPSRACLLTGTYPHQNGMLGLAHRGVDLRDPKEHMLNFWKEAGYTTAQFGIQHVIHWDRADELGYDVIDGDIENPDLHVAEHLKTVEGPFYLEVGFFETHREFPELHPEDDERYVMPPHPLPDTPSNRKDMARFKASARIFDHRVGNVLQALQEYGHAENTIVVCTTDHGLAFPRMKCNLEDSGIGVMMILRGPQGLSGGKVVDAPVTHLDVFPTLCEMTRLKAPSRLEGKSLLPLVNGEVDRLHDATFHSVNLHAAYEPQRAVRTERYKLIRRYDPRSGPVLPNCDAGHSKSTWMEAGWGDRAPVDFALYDLIFDPNEMNNLIDDPDHADVKAELVQRLEAWQKRTKDPLLLEGRLPDIPRALLNPRDGIDPDQETVEEVDIADFGVHQP